jgi:uncharacterized membrane protein YbhN (UPF0104 family)
VLKKFFRLLGPVVIAAVFVAAAWLLYHELRNYRIGDIGARVFDIPVTGIAVAVIFTMVNYAILVAYDWLAIRYVGEKLPLRRIALASFCSYACSYNFGATLAGTTVRLRLYSAWNVPLLKIVQLLVILGLTFWFGLFGLAGTMFVVDPPRIVSTDGAVAASEEESDDDAVQSTGQAAETAVGREEKLKEVMHWIKRIALNMRLWGVVLLALSLIYIGLSVSRLDSIQIFGRHLPVPPFRLTVFQYLVTAADMLVAAIVLYALMHDIPGIPGYLEVAGIYLVVYVAVVLSHVPGGYGVFEGGMVYCLRHGSGIVAIDRVMAAILAFRIIYFWLPLVLAIILLGANEVLLRRRNGESATAG